MSVKVKWMLAFDFIGKERLRFFGEVFLLLISMAALALGIYMGIGGSYSEHMLDGVLANGVSRTGTISMESIFDDDARKCKAFLEEAHGSQYIESIGQCGGFGTGTDNFPELAQIQKGHRKNFLDDEDTLEVCNISAALLQLCRVELYDGEFIKDTSEKGADWFGLYLGYAYKDIPVGTEYTINFGEQMVVYEVLGIFEEGERWIADSVLLGDLETNTIPYEPLDYAVFLIVDNLEKPVTGLWMFDFVEDYTYDEVEAYLLDLAEKHGVEISVAGLEKTAEEAERTTKRIMGYFFKIFYLMGITAVFCILSFQIMSVWKRGREYGIWCAIGASVKDMASVMLIEAFTKLLVAAALSVVPVWLFITGYYYTGEEAADVSRRILMTQVYWKVIVAGIVIYILGLMIPIGRFRKMTPTELI